MDWCFIDWLDHILNTKPDDEVEGLLRGGLAVVLLLFATALPAYLLQDMLKHVPGGWIINVLVATAFIAQKSMRDHVVEVSHALSSSIATARISVAKIVGRDTRELDEFLAWQRQHSKAWRRTLLMASSPQCSGMPCWGFRSGAGNSHNTADDGNRPQVRTSPVLRILCRKTDDIVNLPASRLTALLFAAGAALKSSDRAKQALQSAWDDAGKHNSPNAGWPEAAMASALGLKCGGPRIYEEVWWICRGWEMVVNICHAPTSPQGLALYDRSLWVMFGVLALLAIGL